MKEKVNQLDLEIKEMNALKDQKESFHSSFQQFIIHYFKDEKEVKEKLEMAQINDCVVSAWIQEKYKEKEQLRNEKMKTMDQLTNTILMYKKIIYYQNDENGSIVKSNEDGMCSICVEDKKVQYCMEPCGHLFCDSCTRRLENVCHICRNRIQKKIRIYL